VERLGHDRLPTYAAGSDRKREEWQQMIRQLVAADFLSLDIAGYGGLTLGGQARDLLRGAATFQCRPTVQPKRADRKARGAAAAAVLSDSDTPLLDALKQLRLELAKQRRVPAYVIFADRTLIDMAARRPANEVEFAEVHGVGAAKLKEFANVFLEAIRNHQTA
jgi:ATP-dependent DNA helicase RecQ